MALNYKHSERLVYSMNIRERNRKVAISRWSKVHDLEKKILEKNSKNNFLKARLCGFLAGDGSLMVRRDNNNDLHYVLRFFPDHESIIESFIECLENVYGKTPITKRNYNHDGIVCYSKTVVEDLMSVGKFGITNWRVPFKILKDDKSKIEWLKAFFDSEGYVGKNNIKIQTVNGKGMNDVRKLLLEFGINSRKYLYKPKNENWNSVHILIIGSKQDKMKFLNTVGFNHKLKLTKLRKMLESPNLVWHKAA
jgi:intein/homing endonuclease